MVILRSEGEEDICEGLHKSLEAFSFLRSSVKPIQHHVIQFFICLIVILSYDSDDFCCNSFCT